MKHSIFLLAVISMLFGLVVSGFADDYRIRPGDTIGITVMDEQDLTKRIVVDPEGNINLPLISQMKISDLTLPQATKELTARLSKYIKKPQVTVELVEAVKLQVNISGEVRTPGLYPITPESRLMDALTEAGGYTATADLSKISVTHAGASGTQVVDLYKFLSENDTSANLPLIAGDTIVVPSRTTISVGMVSVLGAVRTPGEKPITKGTTFAEALLAAGGPTELADTGRISIRHQGFMETSPVDYQSVMAGDKAANPELKPGDVIFVEARQLMGFYTIQGGVTNPGRYELKSKTNLTESIAVAGGLKAKAKPKDVRIVRSSGGVTQTLQANVKNILEGKATDVSLQDGDSIYVPASSENSTDYLRLASVLVSIGWLIAR